MERKLSELLNDMKVLEEHWERVNNEMEEGEDKEAILMDLDLAMECIDTCLMYGDYINDTGKPYDYYAE